MKSVKTPRLTLVGAGPGDEELITLKGLKALQNADVVLYDALVNKDMLDYAPDAIKIFVGKRAGQHHVKQDRINELIVENALAHGHVVRLKGGDPFVFGRGHEEAEFAKQFGIDTTIVPGISSCLAAPASASIPVTKRHVNESFWVVTGTTCSHSFSKDLTLAAQSSATVIILMGIRKLSLITQLFEMYRNEDEPIAIVQNATCENQKQVSGTLNNIEALVKENNISSPGVIVIGQVVKESEKVPVELLQSLESDIKK